MKANTKKIPALRFPEFKEQWRTIRIGDLYNNLKTGQTPSRGNPKFFTGNNLWVTSGELNYNYIEDTREKITNEAIKETGLKVYPEGTFFIAITGLEAAGTRGRCAIIKKPATTNQSCMAFEPLNIIDTRFLFLWYVKYGEKLAFRFAQGTKQQSFNNKIVEDFTIVLPKKDEQQKIADFLTGVDERIQQLTKKKQLLELYKKGAMQQLFSQQLRFKDENGNNYPDWEEKKLGEYLLKHSEKTTSNNQFPILTSSRKGLFLQSDYYYNQVASENNIGYNIVPRNYFTYRHMSDDLIFKFNINTIVDFGIVSTLYPVFTTKNINDNYLQIVLNEGSEFRNYAMMQKQGGSRTYMYFNKLTELKLRLPSLREQQKISDFLTSIDNKIEQVQKQIDKTQAYKKGLLQQMFV